VTRLDKAAFDEAVEAGWAIAEEDGREEEVIAYFAALLEREPDNPRAYFEYGGALDYAGREAEAVAPYRQAEEMGLSEDELPQLYVQLGSTLRNIGAYDEAVALLAEGRERFPDDAAIAIFHALALVSRGDCQAAVVELLRLLQAHEDAIDFGGYRRAIDHYSEELAELIGER
jgi:tetratricopeptide (TPR) repeat protein